MIFVPGWSRDSSERGKGHVRLDEMVREPSAAPPRLITISLDLDLKSSFK